MVERWREVKVETWTAVGGYSIKEVNTGDCWMDGVESCTAILYLDKDNAFISQLTSADPTEVKSISGELVQGRVQHFGNYAAGRKR